MTINMEVKKHAMQQLQDGHWKLTLTVHPEDMPVELLQAPMGTPYGLAMVKIDYDNPEKLVTEKTEGEKLRTRAVLLCKDEKFQQFIDDIAISFSKSELDATEYVRDICGIESRSELATNIEAQSKFKELLESFKQWQFESQYYDSLRRL